MPITPPYTPKKMVIHGPQHDPPQNLRVLTKKHNNEKLAIRILIVGVD